MKHLWVGVENRVDEANKRLLLRNALFVDPGKDAGEGRGSSRSTHPKHSIAFVKHDDVVSNSTEVGVTASSGIVYSTIREAGRAVQGASV